MRRDETPSETSMEHLDEGTVHSWLDGALPADEAARVEAHVAECPACAELVAEARGLIAGASRIVGALDVVPGGVIPAPAPASEPVVPIAAARHPVRRPRRWALRAAAAFVVMVGGTALVMRSASRPAASPATYDVAHSVVAAPGPSDVRAEPEVQAMPMMTPAAPPPPAAMADSPPAKAPPRAAPTVAAPVPSMPSARRELAKIASKAAPSVAPGAAAHDTVAAAGSVSAFTPLRQTTTPSVAVVPPPAAAPPSARSVAPVPNAAARAAAGLAHADEAAADAVDRARTHVARVAGCYTLYTVAHDTTVGWPDRVELQSAALPPGGPRGYAARVSSPAADSAYWATLSADSVSVVWFTRAGGVDARLGPADDGALRGTARPFTNGGASGEPRALVAHRVACPSR